MNLVYTITKKIFKKVFMIQYTKLTKEGLTMSNSSKKPWTKKAKQEDYVSAIDKLTASFISSIEEENTAPWHCISVNRGDIFRSANLLYNTPYSGFNRISTNASLERSQNLSHEKYEEAKEIYGEQVAAALRSKFITFNKIGEIIEPDELGNKANVKGISSTATIYQPGSLYYSYQDGKKWIKKDSNGNFALPSKDEIEKFNLKAHRFSGSAKPVWSVLNFIGRIPQEYIAKIEKSINSLRLPPLPENSDDFYILSKDLAESIGVKIIDTDIDVHNVRAGGFYNTETDSIMMRPFFLHNDPNRYFKTVAHECGHASGSEKRLSRESLLNYNTTEGMCREELVAEIASSFICSYFGIPTESFHHEAYIKSYVNLLKDSKKEILSASREAERAAGYVINMYEAFYEKKYGIKISQGIPAHISTEDPDNDISMDINEIISDKKTPSCSL